MRHLGVLAIAPYIGYLNIHKVDIPYDASVKDSAYAQLLNVNADKIQSAQVLLRCSHPCTRGSDVRFGFSRLFEMLRTNKISADLKTLRESDLQSRVTVEGVSQVSMCDIQPIIASIDISRRRIPVSSLPCRSCSIAPQIMIDSGGLHHRLCSRTLTCDFTLRTLHLFRSLSRVSSNLRNRVLNNS